METQEMPDIAGEPIVSRQGHKRMQDTGPASCPDCPDRPPFKNEWALAVHRRQRHDPRGIAAWSRNPKRTKRGPYKKRAPWGSLKEKQQPKAVFADKLVSRGQVVAYCPGCGCNIKAVEMALHLTKK